MKQCVAVCSQYVSCSSHASDSLSAEVKEWPLSLQVSCSRNVQALRQYKA